MSEAFAGYYANPPGLGPNLSAVEPGVYNWSILCRNTSNSAIFNATANRTFTFSFDMGMSDIMNFGGEEYKFSQGPPTPIGADTDTDAVNGYVDLKGLAMKESPYFALLAVIVRGDRVGSVWGAGFPDQQNMNFTIPLENFNSSYKSPYCTQNASSPGDAQFYIYIDIDGNESNGCNVSQNTEVNTTGYDVAIFFNQTTVGGTPEFRICNSTLRGDFDTPGNYNTSSGAVSIKATETCAPDNGMGVRMGILHLMINYTKVQQLGVMKYKINNSQAIDAALLQNNSRMGFYAKSGNGSGIQDSFNAKVYYTPGSMDFIPFDPQKCSNPDYTVAHPECFMFAGGGNCNGPCFGPGQGFFNATYFDNCFTPTGPNCGNPNCAYIPECRGQIEDKVAPITRFTNVVAFADRAFIDWSTNEPSNGSVSFYSTDSNCQNLNAILSESLPSFMAMATQPPDWDFKPFHHIEVDSSKLGFSLSADTLYYYKTTSKDKSNNSAVSNCLSFTTNSTQVFGTPKNISLMPPPGMNFQFDNGNGGYQPLTQGTNYNQTDQRLKFAPTDGSWQIILPGVDFSSDIGIDLQNAFKSNGTRGFVGMDTNKWMELAQKLTTDSIDITIPSTGEKLVKCNDTGEACVDVTSMATLISSGGGKTTWRIPVSLGFSTYSVNSSNSGFNMSSDNVIYQAYPMVSANVTFTNLNSSITGALQNVTVNSSASGTEITIEFYNGSQWISGTAIGTPAKLYENINVSNALLFRFNISMSTATTARWDFSIIVSNASQELNRDSPTANARPYLDSISLNSPASGINTVDVMPDFNFTYRTESDGTTRNCTLYAGAGIYSLGSTTNGTATIMTPGEPLSQGVITWYVTCVYVGGLTSDSVPLVSQSRNLTIDSVTPTIEYAGGTPADSANLSRNWLYINVTAFDLNEANITFSLYNASSEALISNITLGAGNRNVTFINLADGWYMFEVNITDTANQRNNTIPRVVNLDPTYPQVSYAGGTDSDASNLSRNWIYVNLSVVENNELNVSFNLFNSSGIISVSGQAAGNTSHNFTGLGDGLYAFNATITDWANNVNTTVSRTLRIDTLYPAIAFAGGTDVNAANISRNWTNVIVSIVEANKVNVTFYLYNSSYALISNVTFRDSNTSTNFTNLVEGIIYYYNVTVFDVASHSNSTATYSIIVDRTSPTISDVSAGTLTSSGATISWNSSEPVNYSINYGTAATLGSPSSSSTFTNGSQSAALSSLSPGIPYYYNLTSCDTAGNCVINGTYNFTTSAASTTPPSSGGGGGGGGGGAGFNPGTERKIWTQMTPGSAQIMKISDPTIGLKEIHIEVRNPVKNIEITVTKYDGFPASVNKTVTPLAGKVYKYLEIKTKNLDNKDINISKLRFSIPQSWLKNNSVNSGDMVLKKFTVTWIELPTTIVEQNSTSVTYEASSSGFSLFAIATKETVTTTPSPPVNEPAIQPPAEQPPAEQPPVEQPPVEQSPVVTSKEPFKLPTLKPWLFIVAGLVILWILAMVLLMKGGKDKEITSFESRVQKKIEETQKKK
jgi:PGF-pre-PGF domain-containing protein